MGSCGSSGSGRAGCRLPGPLVSTTVSRPPAGLEERHRQGVGLERHPGGTEQVPEQVLAVLGSGERRDRCGQPAQRAGAGVLALAQRPQLRVRALEFPGAGVEGGLHVTRPLRVARPEGAEALVVGFQGACGDVFGAVQHERHLPVGARDRHRAERPDGGRGSAAVRWHIGEPHGHPVRTPLVAYPLEKRPHVPIGEGGGRPEVEHPAAEGIGQRRAGPREPLAVGMDHDELPGQEHQRNGREVEQLPVVGARRAITHRLPRATSASHPFPGSVVHLRHRRTSPQGCAGNAPRPSCPTSHRPSSAVRGAGAAQVTRALGARNARPCAQTDRARELSSSTGRWTWPPTRPWRRCCPAWRPRGRGRSSCTGTSTSTRSCRTRSSGRRIWSPSGCGAPGSRCTTAWAAPGWWASCATGTAPRCCSGRTWTPSPCARPRGCLTRARSPPPTGTATRSR
jgi:hypothetical protein